MRNNTEDGAKGVKPEKLLLVKMAVGVLREAKRDEKRREEKAEKEKQIADMKKSLATKAKAVVPFVDAADKDVAAMEKQANSLKSKAKTLSVLEMRSFTEETEAMVEKAKAAAVLAKGKMLLLVEGLPEEFSVQLKEFLASELKQADIKVGRMDKRLQRAATLIRASKAEAEQKKVNELEDLGSKVVKVLHYNQQLRKLSTEEMFDLLDSKKDGELDEQELVSFLGKADKDLKFLPMGLQPSSEEAVEAKKEENNDAKKEEVEMKGPVKAGRISERRACMTIRRVIQKFRVANEDTWDDLKKDLDDIIEDFLELTGSQKAAMEKEIEKAQVVAQQHLERVIEQQEKDAERKTKIMSTVLTPGVQPAQPTQQEPMPMLKFSSKLVEPKEETIVISAEEVSRLFGHLCEEDATTVTKERFLLFNRLYMKVVEDVALTDDKCIAEGKEVRKLDAKEVVEVLQGPMREETAGATRVEVRALKDGSTGWATATQSDGSVLCKEGGRFFKVIKEITMTESLDIAASSQDFPTRKLLVGEVLELLALPEKEEKSGLMRMKAKTRTDGLVGWVTFVGNTGNVFIDLA